jgi:hypothetical protein
MELSIDADTAERLARGVLSFIALIAWCRWRGTTDDEKKVKKEENVAKKSKPKAVEQHI